jgi:hypothetical protein
MQTDRLLRTTAKRRAPFAAQRRRASVTMGKPSLPPYS